MSIKNNWKMLLIAVVGLTGTSLLSGCVVTPLPGPVVYHRNYCYWHNCYCRWHGCYYNGRRYYRRVYWG